MASAVARDVTEEVRRDLYQKATLLSCAQMDRITIPSVISRLTTDTYNLHRMIGMMQRLGVRAPILLLGGLIVTMSMEPRLGAVLLAMLPFMGLTIWLILRKGIPMYSVTQKKVDRMIQVVRESVTGIRIIKALSKTDYESGRFDKISKDLSDQEQTASITMATTNPLMNLYLNSGLVIVILLGAYMVYSGTTQIGRIIAFQSYFTIILNAVISISRMFVIYSKGSASADRIQEILELPEELQTIPGDPEKDPKAAPDEFLAFDHVSFSYLGQKDNLTNISFTLKRGESLGIIGATGSGKSTIVHLLLRLYDVTAGQIRLNGTDIRKIPTEILHQAFGIVFQSDVLFADTIAENIRFGRELTDEQLKMAARYAQAEEFISTKEDRFAFQLSSRGSNLSGGQKQRLLIARALAGSSPVLVLDDSSSALDYKTDASLRQAIRDHMKDTTSIIIAQRISSIMQSDHILVLDHGSCIGYGTHEELIRTCRIYQEIAQSQLNADSPDACPAADDQTIRKEALS
ncbi:MAG: ABC transporter ATP-binding protein [Lachnospiraceae bacterium]